MSKKIIDESTITWTKIADLKPKSDKLISIQGKIISIKHIKNRISGEISDLTGVIKFFFFEDENVKLAVGTVVKILEGKCKVYKENL